MKIKVNDIVMHYEKIGIGEPLILVHGNQEDHTIFLSLVEAIKDRYTCYLFDSRNHGLSSKTEVYDYSVMADDYLAAIKALHLDAPYYLGYSDGGIIGLFMALMEPKSLKKMIVCGSNIHPLGIAKKEREYMKIETKKTPNPYIDMMLDQPNLTFRKLHKIEIPTMVIAGEFDVIQRRHTLAIHHHIKDSKYVQINKKHHDDYMVHRDDLKLLLSDFFRD